MNTCKLLLLLYACCTLVVHRPLTTVLHLVLFCAIRFNLGGVQATDDSPPSCSVLCHTFQILLSIALYLHLSNKFSPPGMSWSSSSTLSLRVPLQGLPSDVVFRLPQCVPYPPPFSPFQFFLNWWLVGLLPELFVGNLLRPETVVNEYLEFCV